MILEIKDKQKTINNDESSGIVLAEAMSLYADLSEKYSVEQINGIAKLLDTVTTIDLNT